MKTKNKIEEGLLGLSIFTLIVAFANYIIYWIGNSKISLLLSILCFILGLITLNNWGNQR